MKTYLLALGLGVLAWLWFHGKVEADAVEPEPIPISPLYNKDTVCREADEHNCA